MVVVKEFRNLNELNEYLDSITHMPQFDIKPVSRTFEHPQTKILVNSISYVLILNY